MGKLGTWGEMLLHGPKVNVLMQLYGG